MGSAVSWSMVQEIIPQWLYWKLELMQVIVMGFNPQLTHLFEELQPLRKQGWHLWGLNTQSGDAKWCEMSEWTGTPRSFISFSYETSMSRRHCFVRAHAVWLSSHSMTLGAGGLQPPSPMCSWKYSPLILKEDNGVGCHIYGDGKLARPAIIVNDCNFIGLRRRMLLAMNSYMKLVQIAVK